MRILQKIRDWNWSVNNDARDATLRDYSLDQLLSEVLERSKHWNSCAIGERFSIPRDERTNDAVPLSIRDENFSKEETDLAIDRGLAFMDHLQAAYRLYKKIIQSKPRMKTIGLSEDQDLAILKEKPPTASRLGE